MNIGELRAHLYEESRLATNRVSARIAYALDSQVALGSLVKGRASSRALNAELMKSIPAVIGSDLYAACGYWPSKLNRADGPTRDSVPDPPDQDLPWWWQDVVEGRTDAFDAWISTLEAELDQRHPGAALIRQGKPLRLVTGKREDAKTFFGRKNGKSRVVEGLIGVEGDRRADLPSLCPEAVEILESFPRAQVLSRKGVSSFLEAGYSGKGGVARGLVRRGAPWVVSFELTTSATEDLLKKENQRKILDSSQSCEARRVCLGLPIFLYGCYASCAESSVSSWCSLDESEHEGESL